MSLKLPRASVIIWNKEANKILLIYRYYPKIMEIFPEATSPEYYVVPGDGMEEGGTPEQAAVREIKEETNLDVVLDKLLFEYVNYNDQRKEYVFLSTKFDGEMILMAGGPEISTEDNKYELQWIDLDKVKDLNLPKRIKERMLEWIGTIS